MKVFILGENNGAGEGSIFGVYATKAAANKAKKKHPLTWKDFEYYILEFELQGEKDSQCRDG